jgi:hypothetical protein
VGTVNGEAVYGVRAEPRRLPERAVVDPGRHGEVACLAGHVGPVGSVEATAGTAALLRHQPGSTDVTGRDDTLPGRTVGKGVDRRVDAACLRLAYMFSHPLRERHLPPPWITSAGRASASRHV